MAFINPAKEFTKPDLGSDIFLGVVEDNDDPDRLQRCKIRVKEVFGSATRGISTNDLPWASPIRPTSFGGAGNLSSIIIPEVGTRILVQFHGGHLYSPLYVGIPASNAERIPELEINYPNRYGIFDSKGNKLVIDNVDDTFLYQHVSGTKFEIDGEGSITITGVKNETHNIADTFTITAPHIRVNAVEDYILCSPSIDVLENCGGGGAVLDPNPPISGVAFPPDGAETNPPVGFETSTTPEFEALETDEPETAAEASSTVTVVPVVEAEQDDDPALITAPPLFNCTTIDSLPANFNFADTEPSFATFALGFQLSPNFTLHDLTIGPALSNYVFNATPIQPSGKSQKEILQNLCHLCQTTLEAMLAAFGPFTITSGYRSKSGTSQHNIGQAADLQFLGLHGQPNTDQLYFDRAQLVRDQIPFDKFILEWFARNPWFHLASERAGNRNIVLTQTKKTKYTPGLTLVQKFFT